MALKPNIPLTGIIFAILTAVSFSINSVVMNVSLPELGVEIFLIVRYLFLTMMAVPQLILNPNLLTVNRKDLFFLILISAIIGVMSYMGFLAFNYIPPVDASAIYNTHPVIMLIIASIFLKEKCTLYQNIIVMFILVAVILVTQPEFIFGSLSAVTPENRLIGSMLSFSCGFTVTISNALIRYIKHIPLCVVNFYQGFVNCAAFLLIFQRNIIAPSNTVQWLVLLTCGVFGSAGRLFVAGAYQNGEAMIISAFLPLELASVTILQILILGIVPNYLTIIGVLLLMTCIILLAIRVKVIEFLSKIFKKNHEENIPILKDNV